MQALPPWWLGVDIKPEGEDRQIGGSTHSSFSDRQQKRFGVDIDGKVTNQKRHDSALKRIKDGGQVWVTANFTVAPGKLDEFKAACKACCIATRKEPGCIFYDLVEAGKADRQIQPEHAGDGHKFAMLERWTRKAKLDAHIEGPNVKLLNETFEKGQILTGKPVVTVHEPVFIGRNKPPAPKTPKQPQKFRDPSDPKSKKTYTQEEFIKFYGKKNGNKMWGAAKKAAAPKSKKAQKQKKEKKAPAPVVKE